MNRRAVSNRVCSVCGWWLVNCSILHDLLALLAERIGFRAVKALQKDAGQPFGDRAIALRTRMPVNQVHQTLRRLAVGSTVLLEVEKSPVRAVVAEGLGPPSQRASLAVARGGPVEAHHQECRAEPSPKRVRNQPCEGYQSPDQFSIPSQRGVAETTPNVPYALFRAGTKRISTRLFRAAAMRRSIANECPS